MPLDGVGNAAAGLSVSVGVDGVGHLLIGGGVAEQLLRQRNRLKSGWIPVTERLPENDDYVLMSFENFSLPLVGRYVDDEKLGGAWYLGDCLDEDTCLANDLFVNAWMPLPKPYREDE